MTFNDDEWDDHRKNFSVIYDEANYSGSMQSWVMGKSHQMIENKFDKNVFFDSVLEIGAGTGEHLKYVKHSFSSYTFSDSDSLMLDYAKKKNKTLSNGKLSFDIQSGEKLSYPDGVFDRVIATHVLEHIYYPHIALREWCRVLKDGGTLSIVIPTDPGLAWRIGRMLGPRRNAVSKGISYDYLMAREHVNSCINLIAILRHYFPEAIESWWPTSIPTVDLNLFFAFNVKVTK